jgi:hypothetical protein
MNGSHEDRASTSSYNESSSELSDTVRGKKRVRVSGGRIKRQRTLSEKQPASRTNFTEEQQRLITAYVQAHGKVSPANEDSTEELRSQMRETITEHQKSRGILGFTHKQVVGWLQNQQRGKTSLQSYRKVYDLLSAWVTATHNPAEVLMPSELSERMLGLCMSFDKVLKNLIQNVLKLKYAVLGDETFTPLCILSAIEASNQVLAAFGK